MKNTFKVVSIALVTVFTFLAATCSGGVGKSLNSPEALKEYLDSQPANSPDKPIRVSMGINDPMLRDVIGVIRKANKYISLNITGDALKTINREAFESCTNLVSITIPSSVTSIKHAAFQDCKNLASVTIGSGVTSIESGAFYKCPSLTSVTFQGTILELDERAFWWIELRDKYLAGGIGTYKTTAPEDYKAVWTKQ